MTFKWQLHLPVPVSEAEMPLLKRAAIKTVWADEQAGHRFCPML